MNLGVEVEIILSAANYSRYLKQRLYKPQHGQATRHECLSKCSQMTVLLKQPLVRKSYALPTSASGIPTKEGRLRPMPWALTVHW